MRENSKFRLLAEKTKNHRLSLDDTFLEHLGFPGMCHYVSLEFWKALRAPPRLGLKGSVP